MRYLVSIPFGSGLVVNFARAGKVDLFPWVSIPFGSGLVVNVRSTNGRWGAEIVVSIPFGSGLVVNAKIDNLPIREVSQSLLDQGW